MIDLEPQRADPWVGPTCTRSSSRNKPAVPWDKVSRPNTVIRP